MVVTHRHKRIPGRDVGRGRCAGLPRGEIVRMGNQATWSGAGIRGHRCHGASVSRVNAEELRREKIFIVSTECRIHEQ